MQLHSQLPHTAQIRWAAVPELSVIKAAYYSPFRRQTPTIDFPRALNKHLSRTRETGITQRSQIASCVLVGIEWRKRSLFAMERARPAESK